MLRRAAPRLTTFAGSVVSGSAGVHDAGLAIHFLQREPSWAETTSSGAPAPGSVAAKLMKARFEEGGAPSVVRAVDIAAAVDGTMTPLRDAVKADAAFTRAHLTASGDTTVTVSGATVPAIGAAKPQLLVAPLSTGGVGVVPVAASIEAGDLRVADGRCTAVVGGPTDPAGRAECHVLLEYVMAAVAALRELEVACARHVTVAAAFDALECRNPAQQRRVARLAASRYALEACCSYVMGGLTENGEVPLAEARLCHALSGTLLATHASDCASVLGCVGALRSGALATVAASTVDTASSGVAAVSKEVPTGAVATVKPSSIGGLGVDVSLKHCVNPVADDTAALRAALLAVPAASRAVAAAPVVAEVFGSACAAFRASATGDHGMWLRAQIFNEASSLRRKEAIRAMQVSGTSTGQVSDPLAFPVPKA